MFQYSIPRFLLPDFTWPDYGPRRWRPTTFPALPSQSDTGPVVFGVSLIGTSEYSRVTIADG